MVLLSETGPSPVPFIPFPLSGPRGLGEPTKAWGLGSGGRGSLCAYVGQRQSEGPGRSPRLLSLSFLPLFLRNFWWAFLWQAWARKA